MTKKNMSKERDLPGNKIIVAIDFEDQYLQALKQSYHLAKLFDAELLLLYVVEESGVLKSFFSSDDYKEKILPKAQEKLKELEELAKNALDNSNIKINSLVARGKPYEQIIQAAVDYKAVLIVMGKNNLLDKRSKKFIGSNTFNVIRDAPCPVISIKGEQSYSEFSNILLPLDFTKPVKKQIQKAIELGGYFGSTINILSVLPKENKMNKLVKQVQVIQMKNVIVKNGLHCTTEVIESKGESVYKTIINYSRKIDANLIIIMTQQKKKIIPFFVGSTAQEVIYESEIPVLSIIPSVKFKPGVVTSFVDPMGLMEKQPEQL